MTKAQDLSNKIYTYGLLSYAIAMLAYGGWIYYTHGFVGVGSVYFIVLGVLGVMGFLYILHTPIFDAVVFNTILGFHFLGLAYIMFIRGRSWDK